MENDSNSKVSKDPALLPERFPFIVFRKEAFGGFLFNRFLSFTELDPIQSCVIELCNGILTRADIAERVSQELAIEKPVAFEKVESAFDFLDRYYALNWRKQPRLPADRLPDVKQKYPRPMPPALSAPLYALWDITYACNLRCQHCLTSSGSQMAHRQPMRLPEVKQVLDQLVDLRVFYVNFVGGEPFVRKDMLEILEYASTIPIGIIVTTNGLLVDDRLVDRLRGMNIFDLQISIDGLEKTHDTFRGLPGSFEKATLAVSKLTKAGFRVTINTVMTQWNRLELEDLVALAAGLGATSYKAVAFLPVGRGKENITKLMLEPTQLRENLLRLKELEQRYAGTIHIEYEDNYPLEQGHSNDANPCPPARSMGCAAGISQIVIDPYGKIYSCPFLHDLLVGDLKTQSLAEIWSDSYILDVFRNVHKEKLTGKCQSCLYAGVECRGGCRAAAYAVSGDLWAEDPLCWQPHCSSGWLQPEISYPEKAGPIEYSG